MKILLINFFGTLYVLVLRAPGALSHRLEALRDWPTSKNRLPRQ
ncbi:MAG TPA: hypothetical protein VFA57_09850 [Pseudolabrys sp.]|jgi:hypothetical protein|nr:hypothetical protein [Pseudolabrys sp.]